MNNHSELFKINEKNSLAEILAAVGKIDKISADLPAVKIYVLRNYTLEGLAPFLKLHFFRRGLRAEVTFGDFDTIEQSLMSSTDVAVMNQHDIVLISHFFDELALGDFSEKILRLLNLAKSKLSTQILLSNLLMPFYSETGVSSESLGTNTTHQIHSINHAIETFVIENKQKFSLVDFNRAMLKVGESEAIDQRNWLMSAAPFKKHFLFLFGLEAAKVAAALKGKAKKVLVLDCDNTLWGGIIGEDGLNGIKLDANSYPGKAFYKFQKVVVALADQGVMIALNSKNNEADVFEVLDRHPFSVLKKNHLAAWKINWTDKVSNLKSLAQDLNVGIDSFVFVDDNPVECGVVREYLPQVEVLQVPEKIYEYPQLLLKEGWFDTLATSTEDRNRNVMYQSESLRKNESQKFENMDDYLSSLQMIATIHPMKQEELPRVAQLTQKTNQFNLTTLRLSEAQIQERMNSAQNKVYTLSLEDKFGSMGLTGVLFLKQESEGIMIENYLMSCRILGRNVEYFFLQECLTAATRKWNSPAVLSEYKPTAKNSQVENYYDKLGFESVTHGQNKHYRANMQSLKFPLVNYIQVKE